MFRRLFGPFPELDAGLLFQIVLNPAMKKFGAAGHAEAAVFFHYAAAPAGGMNNFQRSAEKQISSPWVNFLVSGILLKACSIHSL